MLICVFIGLVFCLFSMLLLYFPLYLYKWTSYLGSLSFVMICNRTSYFSHALTCRRKISWTRASITLLNMKVSSLLRKTGKKIQVVFKVLKIENLVLHIILFWHLSSAESVCCIINKGFARIKAVYILHSWYNVPWCLVIICPH